MNHVIHVSPSADAYGSDCLHTNTLPEWRVLYVYHSVVNILEVKVYTHTPTHTQNPIYGSWHPYKHSYSFSPYYRNSTWDIITPMNDCSCQTRGSNGYISNLSAYLLVPYVLIINMSGEVVLHSS